MFASVDNRGIIIRHRSIDRNREGNGIRTISRESSPSLGILVRLPSNLAFEFSIYSQPAPRDISSPQSACNRFIAELSRIRSPRSFAIPRSITGIRLEDSNRATRSSSRAFSKR